ncbi:hypothetical protein MVES_001594 [Malassezia vespertilionis]|uniref:Uncharacterized protein n=1 Tax=Malassezia vespertilionis TaxID=2020962 RepID=A0A2N1JDF5_9BASI|nr:hypothetical protein MVES_001594 [Malassezia vespertilionis]
MSLPTQAAKERHYAYLASRHTQHYMTIASEQAAYMADLGVGQASLFMAALDRVDRENEGAEK